MGKEFFLKCAEAFGEDIPLLKGMADNLKAGKCPTCGKEVNMADFRDALSQKEFHISGMCQGCQDGFFE